MDNSIGCVPATYMNPFTLFTYLHYILYIPYFLYLLINLYTYLLYIPIYFIYLFTVFTYIPIYFIYIIHHHAFFNSFTEALIYPSLSLFTSFSMALRSAGMVKYFSAHRFISINTGSRSIPFGVNLYNTFALLSG